MNDLPDMIWIEARKAIRSRLPLWTALGSLFMPFGIAILIFAAKNPEISRQLGLISAKANLIAYSATDWPTYLGLFAQVIAAGGFFLFVLAITWVFGREFADGTLKDMLAVPVQRSSILGAKFAVVAAWCVGLALAMFIAGLVMGAILRLPGGSIGVIFQGSKVVAITGGMVIAVVVPFGLIASMGRGYLLPMGVAVLSVIMANLVVVAGWGDYFPWAVPMLYALGDSPTEPISFVIVVLTGLAGMIGTHLWWRYADQNR
jgi:ABC-2 type transport system permease protein